MNDGVWRSRYQETYRKVHKNNRVDVCVFNRFIICAEHTNCEACEWNPEVEAQRKENLRKDERCEQSDTRTESA